MTGAVQTVGITANYLTNASASAHLAAQTAGLDLDYPAFAIGELIKQCNGVTHQTPVVAESIDINSTVNNDIHTAALQALAGMRGDNGPSLA